MSKQAVDISQAVMEKIHKGEIKMRPKLYFVLGSVLLFAGLVASAVTAIFLFSLMRFLLRSHGPMGEYRLEQILTSFSLWIPIVAILSLALGVVFLRRFDFAYKKNFWVLVLIFVLACFSTGWAIDFFGLDNVWLRNGRMRGMMKKMHLENNLEPGQCMGNCHWK